MIPAFGLLTLHAGVERWIRNAMLVVAVAMMVQGMRARRRIRTAET